MRTDFYQLSLAFLLLCLIILGIASCTLDAGRFFNFFIRAAELPYLHQTLLLRRLMLDDMLPLQQFSDHLSSIRQGGRE